MAARRSGRTAAAVQQEKEALLLLGLLAHRGGAFQKDLTPEPTPALRAPLEQQGLIRVTRRGRNNWIEVTDKGWDQAGTHLASLLPEDALGAAGVLRAWLGRLGTFLESRDLALADMFAGPAAAGIASQDGSSPRTEPSAPPISGDLPERIRAAYLEVTKGRFGTRALLKDIRPRLPDVAREVLDEALKQMQRDQAAILYRRDNAVELTDADHDAALQIAGEPRHILWIRS